jgi:hypothetical protein
LYLFNHWEIYRQISRKSANQFDPVFLLPWSKQKIREFKTLLSLHGSDVKKISKKNNMSVEFPGLKWNIFPAVEFETGTTRDPGVRGVEILMQARPNGRIVDHTRIVLGGSEIIEAVVKMGSVFNSSKLGDWNLKIATWPADIQLRRNMVTGEWQDVVEMLEAREASVYGGDGGEIPIEEVLAALEMPGGSRSVRSRHAASVRWAAMIGNDDQMELVLQSLPESAQFLNGKPMLRR